jgi:hypothetical protein
VESEHPAMRKDEGSKPPEQYDVIDDQTPEQKFTDKWNVHLFFSLVTNV